MTPVGHVDSLWRYPVKSMQGEQLDEAFAGFAGVYGDRIYAIRSSAAIAGFPYLTGREQSQMLLCRPFFRHPEKMRQPPNLKDAEALGSGVTPVYPEPVDTAVDVKTPPGDVFAIDDPQLIARLQEGIRDHQLSLLRSERALTDCRPISIFSTQTARQLSEEVGCDVDKRRFRANIYIDLESGTGFGEDEFVGRTLRIGDKACITVVDRDARCKMITLDPDTAEPNPGVIKQVSRLHDGKAGIYAVVLVEGIIRSGDKVVILS